jgi:hypothetical protein
LGFESLSRSFRFGDDPAMPRSWTLSPEPTLEDGEVAEHVFVGPFTRVTLTDRHVVFSTFRERDRAIAYADVRRVQGGFSAGAHDMRDNSTVVYGVYVAYGDGKHRREEWAWIPEPKAAASIIASRMP